MTKKIDRSAPPLSWFEGVFVVALSPALGIGLGALALVLVPVTIVKEPPKERVSGMTYISEGSRDAIHHGPLSGESFHDRANAVFIGKALKIALS